MVKKELYSENSMKSRHCLKKFEKKFTNFCDEKYVHAVSTS